jgi:hypothetical protein
VKLEVKLESQGWVPCILNAANGIMCYSPLWVMQGMELARQGQEGVRIYIVDEPQASMEATTWVNPKK